MSRRAFTILDGAVVVLLLLGNWALVPGPGRGRPDAVEVSSAAGNRSEPLGRKRLLEVPGPLGTTVLEVEPDGVRVVSSPCPLKLCVREGKITRPGQVVACLPNRVAARLAGASAEGVDAVGR